MAQLHRAIVCLFSATTSFKLTPVFLSTKTNELTLTDTDPNRPALQGPSGADAGVASHSGGCKVV